MQVYKAINGQSFSDVCLNTYGTLDEYVKLLNDNNLSPNNAPYSGQSIAWDELIITDQTIYKKTTGAGTIFATLAGINNNNYFQIVGGDNPKKLPINPLPITIGGGGGGSNMYVQPLATSYTSVTGGESIITVLALQNKKVLQIEREIKPLKASEFIFDAIGATIQLVGIDPLSAGETLFILYTETITL
jgi:hypothetical protein